MLLKNRTGTVKLKLVKMYFFCLQGEKKVAIIQNVSSVIKGSEEPDCHVLLGNHRDAWTCYVDPGSGTATLLDLARP